MKLAKLNCKGGRTHLSTQRRTAKSETQSKCMSVWLLTDDDEDNIDDGFIRISINHAI